MEHFLGACCLESQRHWLQGISRRRTATSISFLVLIVLLLVRPNGILGSRMA